jgi:hypothetical protein
MAEISSKFLCTLFGFGKPDGNITLKIHQSVAPTTVPPRKLAVTIKDRVTTELKQRQSVWD